MNKTQNFEDRINELEKKIETKVERPSPIIIIIQLLGLIGALLFVGGICYLCLLFLIEFYK